MQPSSGKTQACSLNTCPAPSTDSHSATDAQNRAGHLPGPILVFDSGVGGLSIVQALRDRMPDLPLVYACDNGAFPYGLKSDTWLKQRVQTVIRALLSQVQPCLLVLACNTASTVALNELRQWCNIPVVGVVPAIKPAALMTRSGHIALLATQGTISRPYTQQLIDEFAADCTVLKVGSNQLVQLAEKHLAGDEVADEALLDILQPLLAEPRLDTLVLGCTHFPLLQTQLARVAEAAGAPHWQWIDSGAAIARRVLHLLQDAGHAHPCCPDSFQRNCWLTAPLPADSQLPTSLQRFGFDQVQLLPEQTLQPVAADLTEPHT
ncbi:glutamate racemase [Marinospirillum alkaliphilum]|uniref:Glutamate racemase n=1 Tax=Marinospirillum alkaliphilum DSM 21637 TaxID=1122209 RepID=A0A1K1YFZ4_9GAMM|nr:glutamate racemase [Marinospirillum alkaliphilum]SFX60930.1 glutamate racemase [Marinospirillum alkaliphilum DSM 21637]